MEQDRDMNIINKIKSLMMSNEMIRNIFIVKDTEIIGNSPSLRKLLLKISIQDRSTRYLQANSSPYGSSICTTRMIFI